MIQILTSMLIWKLYTNWNELTRGANSIEDNDKKEEMVH